MKIDEEFENKKQLVIDFCKTFIKNTEIKELINKMIDIEAMLEKIISVKNIYDKYEFDTCMMAITLISISLREKVTENIIDFNNN